MENHRARRENHGKQKENGRSGRLYPLRGGTEFRRAREFGEVTVYDRVAQEDVAARIGDAQMRFDQQGADYGGGDGTPAHGWNTSA